VKGIGLGAAAALVLLLPASGIATASGDQIDLRSARSAARGAVQSHSSYRVIHDPSRLRTRSCWRSSRRVVHCSFEVMVGYRCFLDGTPPPGKLCAAVTGYRRWVVRVRAADGTRRLTTRVVSISAG
jgi:hypothetical protein